MTEHIPAYALGILEPDEATAVAAHLADCPACRAELAAHQQVAGRLALAAPDAAPPPRLKARLMQRAQPPPPFPAAERRPTFWERLWQALQPVRPALSLAALLLIVVLGVSAVALWQQLQALQSTPAALVTIHLVGTDAAPDALGTIVVSMNGHDGVVAVDGLPPLDETQQYQLWLIDSAGTRTSGALLSVGDEGYGSAMIEAPQPLLSYATFGMTIEPAGGSPGPTGTKVLGGES